jgi:hypothetical protein
VKLVVETDLVIHHAVAKLHVVTDAASHLVVAKPHVAMAVANHPADVRRRVAVEFLAVAAKLPVVAILAARSHVVAR